MAKSKRKIQLAVETPPKPHSGKRRSKSEFRRAAEFLLKNRNRWCKIFVYDVSNSNQAKPYVDRDAVTNALRAQVSPEEFDRLGFEMVVRRIDGKPNTFMKVSNKK